MLLAAFVLAAAPASGEIAGGGQNNVSVVTTAGQTLGRAGLQVAIVAGPTAAPQNVAEAVAHDCTGCRSVAVAVQAAVMTGDPSIAAPGNGAAAVNANCTGCFSFAYAHQYLFSTSGAVYLDATAQTQIAALREQMNEAADSSLSRTDLTAKLDTLSAKFEEIVEGDLTRAGKPVDVASRRDVEIRPAD